MPWEIKKKDRLLVIFTVAMLLASGLLLTGYLLWGQTLIQDIYFQRSWGFLNRILRGRTSLAVEYYYSWGNRILFDLLSVMVLGTVLLWLSRWPGLAAVLDNRKKDHPHMLSPVIGLGLILGLAVFLRVAWLATVPLGLNGDEACTGYDTFSLLKTGCDRFGTFMPLMAMSGYYEEALYRYLAIPTVALFGLNEFAIRLPAALIGSATIVVVYFLAKEWLGTKAALWTALFLAISPWHIQFSRMAVRTVLLPFVFSLALLLFLKARKKPAYLAWSALLFGISLHTYMSARVFVPLFLTGLFFLFRPDRLGRKHLLSALAVFLMIAIPLGSLWVSQSGMDRARAELHLGFFNIFYYSSYFSPRFLFWQGDPNLRSCIQGMGELHLFEIVPLLAAFLLMFLRRREKEFQLLVLALILYPLPAAFTQGEHALRSIMGVVFFTIAAGLGMAGLSEAVPGKKRKWFYAASALVILASTAVYAKKYFGDYPRYSAEAWEYGNREAIDYGEKTGLPNIHISTTYGDPTIFVLLYQRFSPAGYQALRRSRSVSKLGRYELVSWRDHPSPGLWMIDSREEGAFPRPGFSNQTVHTITYPDGQKRFTFILVKEI